MLSTGGLCTLRMFSSEKVNILVLHDTLNFTFGCAFILQEFINL